MASCPWRWPLLRSLRFKPSAFNSAPELGYLRKSPTVVRSTAKVPGRWIHVLRQKLIFCQGSFNALFTTADFLVHLQSLLGQFFHPANVVWFMGKPLGCCKMPQCVQSFHSSGDLPNYVAEHATAGSWRLPPANHRLIKASVLWGHLSR